MPEKSILDRGRELLSAYEDAEAKHQESLKNLMAVMDAKEEGNASDEDVDEFREKFVATAARLKEVKAGLFGTDWRG